jgi:hypothetical protein
VLEPNKEGLIRTDIINRILEQGRERNLGILQVGVSMAGLDVMTMRRIVLVTAKTRVGSMEFETKADFNLMCQDYRYREALADYAVSHFDFAYR